MPGALRVGVACLLVGLLAVQAACGGNSAPARPTPEPTVLEPVLVNVPPGTVIDLERAAQLHRERDFEGALVIYSAAVKGGTPAEKKAGLLATARIQNETGEHEAAAQTARYTLSTELTPEERRQAQLIAGSALIALEEMDPARGVLEEYLASGGPASAHTQLYLAQIDSSEEELDSAARRLQQVLAAETAPQTEYEAQMLLGGIEVQRDKHEEAIAAYRAAASTATSGTKAAEALWVLAQNVDDDHAAERALVDLIAGYPATDRALEALGDPLLKDKTEPSNLQRAIVLFNHRRNEDATDAFEEVVDSNPVAADLAVAQYDLGILAERDEDWQGAIEHYDAAIAVDGSGIDETRAQASWDKGTVLELIGQTSDAVSAYAAVSEISPTANRAEEGLFRAGYLSFLLTEVDDSTVYWTRYRGLVSASEDVARADYWLATAALAQGDAGGESVYLMQAATDDDLDYYGMRAAALLAGEFDLPEALEVTPEAPDWNRYEVWLAGWAGPEDGATSAARDALFASERWLGAVDLLRAGLPGQADAEFRALLNDNATDAWLTYRLVRATSEYHRPWLTSPAAAGLLLAPDAPPEALQLVYPLEYWELVQEEAAANGISPLLLLALIRQESLYDPAAVSVANALGLTQVVPDTAEGIAQDLGIDDFEESDLLTAKTGVKFGAYYLARTLEGFGGALPPTFAGYNAGPGTAGAWWEEAGLDPDLFLESIPFAETRLFVEVVLENYARYLYAYGVVDIPTLPLS